MKIERIPPKEMIKKQFYLVFDVELWLTAVSQTLVAVWPLPVEKRKSVSLVQFVNRTSPNFFLLSTVCKTLWSAWQCADQQFITALIMHRASCYNQTASINSLIQYYPSDRTDTHNHIYFKYSVTMICLQAVTYRTSEHMLGTWLFW